MSLLETNNVIKYFGERQALNAISIQVKKGEKVAVVGETGSGKSTLLKVMGGLETIDSGKVLYQQEQVLGPDEKLIPGHSEVIYLSQHFTLPRFISVREHLDNAYVIAPDEAEKIYQSCEIEHLLSKGTEELSGGEKQRVALAKVLTKTPKALLLDEPFSNLDYIHKRIIKEVLDKVHHNLGTTVIMVSHEPRDVLAWADKVAVLRKGSIIQIDKPHKIYHSPKNEYVAGLFGLFSLIQPEKWNIPYAQRFTSISGKLIVRPEQFVISKTIQENAVTAQVIDVNFQGSFYELILKMATQNIIVQTNCDSFQKGDKVWVNLT